MDPFSLNLLGQIRQQELLEQASKDKQDTRRWRWKISTFQLEIRQEHDDAARTPPYLTEERPPLYRLRLLATRLLHLGRQAKQYAPTFTPQEQLAAQRTTDPQCASEC
jgi:hypothetical protein